MMIVEDIQHWVPLLWALLLALPGSVTILLNRTMKLQTSAGFRFVMASLVVLFIAIFLSTECYMVLFPSVMLCVSLIGAGMFVTGEGRARNIYLLVLLTLWFVVLGSQVWSNYMMS